VDVEAMRAVRAPGALVNDFAVPADNGTPAKQLYDELVSRGIDVMVDHNLRPEDITGLKKYMEKLNGAGLTAAQIQADFRGRAVAPNADEDVKDIIRDRIYSKIETISGEIHRDASEKAVAVREVVHSANDCIGAIADAIIAANSPDADAASIAFNNAIDIVDQTLNGPLGLRVFVNDFNADGVGASGGELRTQKHEIRRIREALGQLVALWISNLSGNIAAFHKTYITLCARNMAGTVLTACDRKDPATAANGNKSFSQRYTDWINTNRGGVMPVNNHTYDNEVRYL
jgi:hypothetical protein